MIRANKEKLLDIFVLGLRSGNKELKIEIVNYIATENMIEALGILEDYATEEEAIAIRFYMKEVIEYLKNKNKKTTPIGPAEGEDTLIIDTKKGLTLRLSSLKE